MRIPKLKGEFLLVFSVLSVFAGIFAYNHYSTSRRYEKVHVIEKLVMDLRERRPDEIPKEHWDVCSDEVSCATGVCYSEHTTLAQIESLDSDLRQKLREPITLDTLRWIMARLSAMVPHGRNTISACRENFELWDSIWTEIEESSARSGVDMYSLNLVSTLRHQVDFAKTEDPISDDTLRQLQTNIQTIRLRKNNLDQVSEVSLEETRRLLKKVADSPSQSLEDIAAILYDE